MLDHDLWRIGSFAFVGAWWVLLLSLSMRLRTHHQEIYQQIGMPALLANAIQASWRLLTFLYAARFRALGDRFITGICLVMCIVLPTAVLWMFWPVVRLLAMR